MNKLGRNQSGIHQIYSPLPYNDLTKRPIAVPILILENDIDVMKINNIVNKYGWRFVLNLFFANLPKKIPGLKK